MNNAKKELLVKPKALKRRQQDSNQRSGSCSPTPYHLAMSPQITICLQIGCSGWKLAKQVVRQNTAFRSLQTKHYCQAPRVGLEPTTLRLTAECSTIELSRKIQVCSQTWISEICLQISPPEALPARDNFLPPCLNPLHGFS